MQITLKTSKTTRLAGTGMQVLQMTQDDIVDMLRQSSQRRISYMRQRGGRTEREKMGSGEGRDRRGREMGVRSGSRRGAAVGVERGGGRGGATEGVVGGVAAPAVAGRLGGFLGGFLGGGLGGGLGGLAAVVAAAVVVVVVGIIRHSSGLGSTTGDDTHSGRRTESRSCGGQ